jgi:hypothetical protein
VYVLVLSLDHGFFLAAAWIFPTGQTIKIVYEMKHFTIAVCKEGMLSPGEETGVGTQLMLSRVVVNYLVIMVLGQGWQLAAGYTSKPHSGGGC